MALKIWQFPSTDSDMTSSQDEQVGNSHYAASYNYLVSSGVTFDTSSRVQMAKVINQ